MARRTYGRTRRSRRGTGGNRRYYIIGMVVLVALGYLLWPNRGEDTDQDSLVDANTPAPKVASENAIETVLQATEFPVTTSTTSPQHMELPKALPAGQASPSAPTPAVREVAFNSQVEKAVQESMALLRQNPNRLVEVRTRLNDLMLESMTETQRELVRQALGQCADKWLFSRHVYADDPLCGHYNVLSGDQFRRIGLKYKVPYEILMKVNGIANAYDLKADSRIKIINGPFHAKVYRSTYRMDLYLQQTFVKSYKVGLGAPGQETPTGTWLVKQGEKLIQPPWPDPVTGRYFTKDDPDYPLGSRWIALQGVDGEALGRSGFAIHGTKDPETIGTRSSHGCIRLYNGDVKEVYDLLLDGVSKVLVFD